MKGTGKIGTNTNIKSMLGLANWKDQLHGGDYIYANLNDGETDLINFDHYYLANGTRIELGGLYKVSIGNIILSAESEIPLPPPTDVHVTHDIRINNLGQISIDNGDWS